MEIKVLGSGCAKCSEMERVARSAVEKMGVDATVEKVTDFAEIISYGVLATPALVIDGELRLSGRVPSVDDMVGVLLSSRGDKSGSGGCGCDGNCC